ncbi:transposase [Lactiplantibacillus plantarum]|nr:transposase [Lactiplantibacillus plantarum]
MRNGQLKTGYNLQVASQNQYALYYRLFSKPTDTRTLVPYGMYQEELTRSYHKGRRKVTNWQYNESGDTYTDLDGI